MTGWKGRSDPLEHRGDALTDADAHRHQRIVAPGALQLTSRGQRNAWARRAEWMTDRDRPAVLIDPAVIERQFQPAQAGQYLGGKGLIDLDYVDVRKAEAGTGERLLRGGNRTDAHDPRRHAGDGASAHPDERFGPRGLTGPAAGNDHRHRTVIDARSVASGRHPALLQWPQFGKGRQIGLRARMFVLGDLH